MLWFLRIYKYNYIICLYVFLQGIIHYIGIRICWLSVVYQIAISVGADSKLNGVLCSGLQFEYIKHSKFKFLPLTMLLG